jgi:hypothetical protein
MVIKFHCSYCGKKIEAPDTAGGKWGKCPACHAKLYVPQPQADDELKLAPIDESEEQRKKQLLQETFRLTQDILQEKNVPQPSSAGPATEISEEQLTKSYPLSAADVHRRPRRAEDGGPHRAAPPQSRHRSGPYYQEQNARSRVGHSQQVLSGLVRTCGSRWRIDASDATIEAPLIIIPSCPRCDSRSFG